MANLLPCLEPNDMCKLARLNRAFRGASLADFVWDSKLPSNNRALVDKVFDEMPLGLCKKDIYVRLCRTNPIDGGTKRSRTDEGANKKKSNTDVEEKENDKDVKKETKHSEPPHDFIHVRARRGQAIDSHNIAERETAIDDYFKPLDKEVEALSACNLKRKRQRQR